MFECWISLFILLGLSFTTIEGSQLRWVFMGKKTERNVTRLTYYSRRGEVPRGFQALSGATIQAESGEVSAFAGYLRPTRRINTNDVTGYVEYCNYTTRVNILRSTSRLPANRSPWSLSLLTTPGPRIWESTWFRRTKSLYVSQKECRGTTKLYTATCAKIEGRGSWATFLMYGRTGTTQLLCGVDYKIQEFSFYAYVGKTLCENVLPPVNGRLDKTDNSSPRVQRVDFSCYDGYRLVGNRYLVCLDNGRWSGLVPTCIFEPNGPPADRRAPLDSQQVNCSKLSKPDHCELYGNSTISGTSVHFLCHRGYHLASGNKTRTCLPSGQWSGTQPVCERIQGSCGRADYARVAIHRGSHVHDQRKWPWMVSLQWQGSNRHFCGGTLIDANWVLTAAHCVEGLEDEPEAVQLVLGSLNLDDEERSRVARNVTSIHMHHRYQYRERPLYVVNDIALIHVNESLPFTSHVKPACLPDADSAIYRQCHIIGWGRKEEGGRTGGALLEFTAQTFPAFQCATAFPNMTHMIQHGNFICAIGGEGARICGGDSGGPMLCHTGVGSGWAVVGVASWMRGPCGFNEWPFGFAEVKPFLPWIRKTCNCL